MTITERLSHLYQIYSPILSPFGRVYIAGGAVRDTWVGREPRDYDFFVCVGPDANQEELAVKIREAMNADVKPEARRKRTYGGNSMITEFIHRLFGGDKNEAVTDGRREGDCKIQVILSSARDVNELLEDFDWNICQFAYGNIGGTVKMFSSRYDVGGTTNLFVPLVGELGEDLILNHTHFPIRAMKRGFDFADRYKMNLRKADILRLCQEAVETENVYVGPVHHKAYPIVQNDA